MPENTHIIHDVVMKLKTNTTGCPMKLLKRHMPLRPLRLYEKQCGSTIQSGCTL